MIFHDNILKRMSPEDRALYAKDQMTSEEALKSFVARVEGDLHKLFIRWLDLHAVPHGHCRMDVKSTLTEGHPDFSVYSGNRVLLIEFKMPGKYLKPEQVQFKAKCALQKTDVHVLNDVMTAIDITRKFLTNKEV